MQMVPELEKAHVTEIHVRMDCHGCVQKIKKAMQNVDGVYSLYIDLAQQKLTVVGTAEPEKIVKAIKKIRKTATICSHTEPASPNDQPPPPPEQPVPEAAAAASQPPPPEAPPAPETEPPKDAKPEQIPTSDVKPSPFATDSAPTEVREIHMVHHYPNEHWDHYYASESEVRYEPVYNAVHSYSSYRPTSYISQYGYAPQPEFRYITAGDYSDGYYYNRSRRHGGASSSILSDENPNACTIV